MAGVEVSTEPIAARTVHFDAESRKVTHQISIRVSLLRTFGTNGIHTPIRAKDEAERCFASTRRLTRRLIGGAAQFRTAGIGFLPLRFRLA
jgi:hypothetical protein